METEEGEILSEEESYTPLERPSTYSSTLTRTKLPDYPEVESEEEPDSSSDSDSDLDTKKSKHQKLKVKPVKVKSKNNPRKKYDIWSTHLQEDVLLENLVNCDVSHIDRSRAVETYPLATHMLPKRQNNKRTYNDRNKSHIRLNKRINDDESDTVNGSPRLILDVRVTSDDSEDAIAKDIANKLYEEKEDLIRTIVAVAGKEKALELFKETKRIEAGGGMLIMNQTRRRTPGGVYFFLVKHDNNLTRAQQSEIFQEEKVKYKQEVRTKRKLKLNQIKQKIAASKRECEQKLPELLTHAELCVQELTKTKTSSEGETEDLDVKNPPPSPVTDGHDNSTDGMENISKEPSSEHNMNRNIINYEDCTDTGIEMELF